MTHATLCAGSLVVAALLSNSAIAPAAFAQAGVSPARTIANLGARDGAQSIALSPDGSFILLGSEKALESVQLSNGRVTQIAAGDFRNVVWAQNGSRIAFERWDSTDTGEIWSASTDARTGRLTSAPVRLARAGDTPAISPDGSLIAFAGDDSVGQSIRIIASNGAIRTLARLDRGGSPIGWAADGQTLLYAADRGAIRTFRPIFAVPAAGGAPREIISFNLTSRPRFSPDRSRLLFRSAADTISIADTSGRVLTSFKMDSPEIGTNAIAMVWTASNKLVFAERQDSREVVALDIASGAMRAIPQAGPYVIFPTVSPDGRSVAALASFEGQLVVSVAPMNGGSPRVIRTSAPAFKNQAIEWSPDSRYIAVRVGSAEHPGHANAVGLELVDTRSGVSRPSATAPDVRTFAWSPDSRAVRYFHVPAGLGEGEGGSQIREVTIEGVDRLVHTRTGPRGGHNVFQDFDHFFGIVAFSIVDLRTGQESSMDTVMRARAPANVAVRPSPSFSPDGRWLAGPNSPNGRQYTELRLVDTRERTARTIPLAFRPTNVREGVLWFPDGSHVLTPGRGPDNDYSVYLVRVSDGFSRRVNLDGSEFPLGASMSPDGTTLVTSRESRASTLRLMEIGIPR